RTTEGMGAMTRKLAALLCLAALGCTHAPEKAKGPTEPDYTSFVNADCYTVDLFDRFELVPPGQSVPAEWRGYVGEWGNGAWNGKWCHDLTILSVSADGEVDLLDMHAPQYDRNISASVYRRKGFIDRNGHLRFTYLGETHVYRLDGRYLVGERQGDIGQYRIAMTRKDVVPLPSTKPERLALGE
ncbi:MAG: hypothetical protein AAF908_12180, partial [Pseudomonadota bacterium]